MPSSTVKWTPYRIVMRLRKPLRSTSAENATEWRGEEPETEIGTGTLPYSNHMTLSKVFQVNLSFLICKMEPIATPYNSNLPF